MNVIFLDFECVCGQDVLHNEIIQIGAIKVDSKGNIIDKFNSFVKPVFEKELTDYCKILTGIKQDDVDNAKEFSEIRIVFEEWAGKDTIFTWGEDVKMWNNNCYLLDTDNNIYEQFVDYQKIIKNLFKVKAVKSLDFILKSLNVESIYSHNALDDAISLYDFVKKVNPAFDDIYFKNYSNKYDCNLKITPIMTDEEESYHFYYEFVSDVFGVFYLHEFTILNKKNISLIRKEKEQFKNKGKMKNLKNLNISFNSYDEFIYYKKLKEIYLPQ